MSNTSSKPSTNATSITVDSRLELFVDDYLIDRLEGGARLQLHHPVPQGLALVCDKPWEMPIDNFMAAFQDGEKYLMYYRALHVPEGQTLLMAEGPDGKGRQDFICYAESSDGLHWERPEIGLFAFAGSKKNNIVWSCAGTGLIAVGGLMVFKDTSPSCTADARYKALASKDLGSDPGRVYWMKSADGLRWSLEGTINPPMHTDGPAPAFWDTVRGEYRWYLRAHRTGEVIGGQTTFRDIKVATSKDFVNWTEPPWLRYPGAPDEQMYTNNILPYYRAPHILLGFPTRYIPRAWTPSIDALPEPEARKAYVEFWGGEERSATALTDGVFMSSRDGRTFNRWGEAFIRPGLRLTGGWFYGDCMQNWGLVETPSPIEGAPRELSIYVSENYTRVTSPTRFRRYSLRIDGFVSVAAPLSGGECVTKPLVFQGKSLVLNFSASAAGSVRVEIQDAEGRAIEGYYLRDCWEVLGDDLERVVSWKGGSDVGKLAGIPIRLRFVLKDADVYALRFRN